MRVQRLGVRGCSGPAAPGLKGTNYGYHYCAGLRDVILRRPDGTSGAPPRPLFTPRVKAILVALFVTFLWATSWILIKVGLRSSLPPLTFAGLRYTLGFLCLAPLVLINRKHRRAVRRLDGRRWLQLTSLGLLFYSITQGAQFVGLFYLPVATLNLILSLTPIVVTSAFLVGGGSSPPLQLAGVVLSAAGAITYFLPGSLARAPAIGFVAAVVCLLSNSASSLLGRHINSRSGSSPLVVTTVSMGIGGVILLVVGLVLQGIGPIGGKQLLIIAWLALANTAVAFTLWNHTLRTLTAVESTIINGTLLPQAVFLAWIFLDEALVTGRVVGLLVVSAGTLLVQLGGARSRRRNRGRPVGEAKGG